MASRALRIAICLFVSTNIHAVKIQWSTTGSLTGGQYFTSSNHSDGINADLSINPLIQLTSRFYLIPIYRTTYSQTQSVYTFQGENTLIQRQWDHLAVLRGSYVLNSQWKLRPRMGYKLNQAKQSVDESLSEGLFNNHRLFAGVGLQRAFPNSQLEGSYEWGQTRYPNYQSLLSDDRITSLGIDANAGQDVLDYQSHLSSLDYTWETADQALKLNYRLSWLYNRYKDQKIVEAENGFAVYRNRLRQDHLLMLNLSQAKWLSTSWYATLGETVQYSRSNQNSYNADAALSGADPFTKNYYDYAELQLMPTVTWISGSKRLQLTVGGSYGYRPYFNRRAQDGQGLYQNQTIYTMSRGASIALRYHLWKGFSAVVQSNVLTYWSNTRYELNYPYNYTVYNYQGGLSWEY